jgi:hypothetical protein
LTLTLGQRDADPRHAKVYAVADATECKDTLQEL